LIKSDQSFLYIPDITGFTEFVNTTEIQHGQHIISELLEIIIDSNQLGLKVSEVEGDAVLFYAHQKIPTPEELFEQTKTLFINFHNHLKKYESERICQCGACLTTSSLSLKMIAHAGEIGFTSIKNTEKPYGADMVMVHRLLKNDVNLNEYLLISNKLVKHWQKPFNQSFPGWAAPNGGETNYEKLGKVSYNFITLAPLHDSVADPPARIPPKLTSNPIVREIYIDRPIYQVLEVVINLDLRLTWNKVVNELEYEEGKISRVGTKHRCFFDSGFADFESITNDFGEEKLVYGERFNSIPIVKEVSTYYILNEEGSGTGVRLEIHIDPLPIIGWLFSFLLKTKLSKTYETLMADLKIVCEQQPVDVRVGT